MTRRKIGGALVALAALAGFGLPAGAGAFNPPEGCEAFLTVQSRGCRVSNHYRCEADAPGDQWRADFGQEGVTFLSRIDSEGQWLESYDAFPTVRQTLDAGARDPASMTDLLVTGRDDFDFGLSKDNGVRTLVTGFDQLTGKSFVIDGITLRETEFEFTETDPQGKVLNHSWGNEFVHPEWRLFFAGPSQWNDGTDTFPTDDSPVQFVFPGEPGFGATVPIFECDVVTSSYPMSRKPMEAPANDDL
ncbi:MAG: hypothetical protein Q8P60_01790 [Pseudorhodobacter sp.]|nr:hypothetical protein [Pseudorhodobacter sp.]